MEAVYISVIIPVYNVDIDRFKQCISSVLKQKYYNYEIVVIDDGSMEELSTEYNRVCDKEAKIRYFKTENRGVSAARNYGVKVARGEYITFVDSDDEILDIFLSEASEIIKNTNLSYIIGGLAGDGESYIQYNSIRESDIHFVNAGSLSEFKKHMIDEWIMFDSGGHINRGPVSRLIKREIALESPFNESISIGEDMLWNLHLLNMVTQCAYVERVWYIYHFNENSATHKKNNTIIQEELKELRLLKKEVNFKQQSEYIAFCNHIFECMKRIHECYIQHVWDDKSERRMAENQIYHNEPWIMVENFKYIKIAPWHHKLKSVLFRMRMLFLCWKLKDVVTNLKESV